MSDEPGIVRYVAATSAYIQAHTVVLALAFLGCAVIYWFMVSGPDRPTGSAKERAATRKLGHLLGYPPEAARFVKWARDDQATGAVIVIRTPDTFTATSAKITQVRDVITQLAGGEWSDEVDLLHDRITLTRRPPPGQLPELYPYPLDNQLPAHLVPFAVDASTRPILADMRSESPHVLVAGATGKGKTTVLSVFVAHIGGRGGLITVCDPKMVGYVKAFRGLHNVEVVFQIQDMVNAVHEVFTDMRERYTDEEQGVDVSDRPLRVLVIDEMGSFTAMVTEQWQDQRDPKVDPVKPPAVSELSQILWQGRHARVHVIMSAQQANAAVIGSTDKREQFAMRIGCGPQGKRGGPLLFGHDDIPDVDPKVKGRGVVSLEGGDPVAVQLAYLDEQSARDVCSRGVTSFVAYRDQMWSAPPVTVPDDPQPVDKAVDPVTLECAACSTRWETKAKVGSSVKCPKCRTARRVPVGAR